MDEEPLLTQPPPTQPPPSPWRRRARSLAKPAVLAACIVVALFAWQWWETRERLGQMERELATRLAASDQLARQGRSLAQQNQQAVQSLQDALSALEARLAEAQSQQLALEAMYQEVSRTRDERLLAEVEQAVSIAAQQLALAGNVEAALIALQGADAGLAAAGAQFLQLRKLIHRDIERLKAQPLADLSGIALRLEGIIASVDGLPLAFEQRHRPGEQKPAAPSPPADGFWQRLGRELWLEIKQLVRIERIDQSEPALLSPSQAFFLRENLKLRLLDAKLALLQKDGRIFREDLRHAREWLHRYFDVGAKAVDNAIAAINDLIAIDISPELPNLNDTLAAVRGFKTAGERGVR